MQETEVYETLKDAPHKNIAGYHGCIVEDGRITGLCLKKHDATLSQYVKGATSVDVDRILAGIRSGMEHLQSLGLVHNDINLSNVMLDDDSSDPVIIDFDSCQPRGSSLQKGGTFGVSKEDATTAEDDNDEYGLEQIRLFLMQQRDA